MSNLSNQRNDSSVAVVRTVSFPMKNYCKGKIFPHSPTTLKRKGAEMTHYADMG